MMCPILLLLLLSQGTVSNPVNDGAETLGVNQAIDMEIRNNTTEDPTTTTTPNTTTTTTTTSPTTSTTKNTTTSQTSTLTTASTTTITTTTTVATTTTTTVATTTTTAVATTITTISPLDMACPCSSSCALISLTKRLSRVALALILDCPTGSTRCCQTSDVHDWLMFHLDAQDMDNEKLVGEVEGHGLVCSSGKPGAPCTEPGQEIYGSRERHQDWFPKTQNPAKTQIVACAQLCIQGVEPETTTSTPINSESSEFSANSTSSVANSTSIVPTVIHNNYVINNYYISSNSTTGSTTNSTIKLVKSSSTKLAINPETIVLDPSTLATAPTTQSTPLTTPASTPRTNKSNPPTDLSTPPTNKSTSLITTLSSKSTTNSTTNFFSSFTTKSYEKHITISTTSSTATQFFEASTPSPSKLSTQSPKQRVGLLCKIGRVWC